MGLSGNRKHSPEMNALPQLIKDNLNDVFMLSLGEDAACPFTVWHEWPVHEVSADALFQLHALFM